MSMFLNKAPNQNGGGGGTSIDVVDNLITDSGTKALSARQGKELDEKTTNHDKKIASDTVLGHVKVDGETIIANADGVISVADNINDTEETVVFGILGMVKDGAQDSHNTIPFNCKIKNITVSILTPSTEDIYVNIQQSLDYITWENVLPNNITAPKNSYFTSANIVENIEINSETALRLYVETSTNDAKNLSLNLNVNRI